MENRLPINQTGTPLERHTPDLTITLAALQMLVHHDLDGADDALDDFEQRHGDNSLVLDKWFAVQAARPHAAATDRVARLMRHPAFRLGNPNREIGRAHV